MRRKPSFFGQTWFLCVFCPFFLHEPRLLFLSSLLGGTKMLLWTRNKHIISRLLIVKLILAFGLLTLYPLQADGKRTKRYGYPRKDGTYLNRTATDSNPKKSPSTHYSQPSSDLRELLRQLETGDGKYRLQKSPNRYRNRRASRAASAEVRDLAHQMKNPGATYKHIPDSWIGDRGSSRKDRTDPKPRYRRPPDSNPYNNYSSSGNLNPNIGRITTSTPWKSPKTRYKRRAARSAPVGIDEYLKKIEAQLERNRAKMYGYPRKDRTYATPHYRTATDSKSYNNDSSLGNFNPNLGPISTSTPWKAPNTHYSQPSTDLRELLRQLESGGAQY